MCMINRCCHVDAIISLIVFILSGIFTLASVIVMCINLIVYSRNINIMINQITVPDSENFINLNGC